MRQTNRILARAFTAAAFLAPLLVGCISYEMKTAIRPDGSGTRAIRVELRDLDMPVDEVRAHLVTENEDRWVWKRETADSTTVDLLLSERKMRSISSWEKEGGVLLRGAREGERGSDILFRNAPEVRIGEGPGGKTLVYRETFYWTRLIESYIEWKVEHHRSDLVAAYPDASPADLGEAIGLLKGAMRHVIEADGLDMDPGEREEAFLSYVKSVLALGLDALRRSEPGANADELTEVAWAVLIDMDKPEDELFESALPGFGLAMETEIVCRLSPPGEVVDTNAEGREGDALVWRFTPLDAAVRPVELRAEARLP